MWKGRQCGQGGTAFTAGGGKYKIGNLYLSYSASGSFNPWNSQRNFVTFCIPKRSIMKVAIFLLLLTGFSIVSSAQTDVFRLSIKEYNAEDMYNIPRNAVYTDLLAFYNFEYLAPLDYLLGLTTKLGVLNSDKIMVVVETGLVAPGPQHFGELGVGALINTGSEGYDFSDNFSILSGLENDIYFTLRAGYRYQAPGGFLFKVGGLYSPGNFIIPLLGMGYVF